MSAFSDNLGVIDALAQASAHRRRHIDIST
jgi:hypothetical protein